MIRTIDVREISKNIKEMCIEANHFLSEDMKKVFKPLSVKRYGHSNETGGAGRKITAWKTDIGTAAGKFKNCG